MGTTIPGGIYALNGSYYHANGELIDPALVPGLLAERDALLNNGTPPTTEYVPPESIEYPAPVLVGAADEYEKPTEYIPPASEEQPRLTAAERRAIARKIALSGGSES